MAVKLNARWNHQHSCPHAPSEEWIARIGRLQDALAVCPTDILARCELATLLEKLEQPEEALCNWNAVLACDPNSLKAEKGWLDAGNEPGGPCSPLCERDHAHDLGPS